MTPDRAKVSVCVVAYNQVEYIRECLQSVVSQQASFPFEVLVGDDCSTDGTSEIVAEFAANYDFVHAFLRPKNVGPFANAYALYAEAQGEYQCHLDGDDYYLPGKLQIQADYLDAEQDVAFVSHEVITIDRAGNQVASSFSGQHPHIVDANYLLQHGCFFTNFSKMVRRQYVILRHPEESPCVDFQGHLEEAIHGKIAWMPTILGAYRVSQGIASSPAWARIIDDAYDRAFRQAVHLGYSPSMVQLSRRRHFASLAIRALRRRRARHFLDLLYRLACTSMPTSEPPRNRRTLVGVLLFLQVLPELVLQSVKRRWTNRRGDGHDK